MDTQLILFLVWAGSVLAILGAFIWVALRLGPKGRGHGPRADGEELFSEDFRQRIRERGVARFEHTLDQNAAFLQQDLHAISDDISEYIKDRAGEILKQEFGDQKQSVAAAQEHMSEAFAKIDHAITDYQKTMSDQFNKELLAEKERRLTRFQENMADVVTHHVQQTLSTHMDVSDQVQYIVGNLEENKTAIIEDIKREL